MLEPRAMLNSLVREFGLIASQRKIRGDAVIIYSIFKPLTHVMHGQSSRFLITLV